MRHWILTIQALKADDSSRCFPRHGCHPLSLLDQVHESIEAGGDHAVSVLLEGGGGPVQPPSKHCLSTRTLLTASSLAAGPTVSRNTIIATAFRRTVVFVLGSSEGPTHYPPGKLRRSPQMLLLTRGVHAPSTRPAPPHDSSGRPGVRS